jgi:hypothetical protein
MEPYKRSLPSIEIRLKKSASNAYNSAQEKCMDGKQVQ